MNRGEIKSVVKNVTGRNFSGIDGVLDNLINTAIELFGSVIASVYDDEEWIHVITQAEVDDEVDNWRLPEKTKHVQRAVVIDSSGQEPIYYPLEIVSPMDWYDVSKLDSFEEYYFSYDYTVETPRFGDGLRLKRATRIDYAGLPKFTTRIGTNLFVYPRPGKNEVGHTIRLLLAVRPGNLSLDTDTNVITEKYPYALIWYVSALLWIAHLNDAQRGQSFLQTASLLMSSFATEQEIGKLIGITLKVTRR